MTSRVQTETEQEQAALLANDIKVLIGELNESIKRAAEKGLRVHVEVSSAMDFKASASLYPALSIGVLAEVQ